MGLYSEAGAAYSVTDHLSLGATGTVGLSYSRSRTTSSGSVTQRTWQYVIRAPDLAIVAALYF